MKKHTKIYLDFFGYGIDDYIPCTVCSKNASDIHHINFKGIGGSKNKDNIENLITLCRECHIEAHNHTLTKEQLIDLQKLKIEQHGK